MAKLFCGGVEGSSSSPSLSNVSETPAEKFTSESALSCFLWTRPPPAAWSVLVCQCGNTAPRGSAAQSLSLFNFKALWWQKIPADSSVNRSLVGCCYSRRISMFLDPPRLCSPVKSRCDAFFLCASRSRWLYLWMYVSDRKDQCRVLSTVLVFSLDTVFSWSVVTRLFSICSNSTFISFQVALPSRPQLEPSSLQEIQSRL